jgi:phage gp29-like protein
MLQGRIVEPRSALDESRTYYGRSLDLARIEQVIKSANGGFMQPMVDLSAESLGLDGHMCATVQKRLNRISALPYSVVPATGEGINDDLAKEMSALVQNQIRQFDFRSKINDLAWGTWHGRSCQELEWAQTGSRNTWAVVDMHWIHARRLSFGPYRELRITRSDADAGSFVSSGIAVESIPWKFCWFTPRLFDDYPEREGLSPRGLYWSFFGRFGTRERLILLEIFGKPWRIVELDPEVNHNPRALADADEAIDALGASSTARVPPGVHVNVVSPNGGAGNIHRETIKDAKEEISKLVLGVTGTTDSQSTGLNSNQANVHSDEQWLVVAGDAGRVSAMLTYRVARAIVAVNRPEALSHAPMIIIRAEPPPDVKQELERIDAATHAGMRVSLEEAHQRTGYRRPSEDEPVLELVSDPGAEAAGGQPRARIVYPVGQVPASGALPPSPPVEFASGVDDATGNPDVSITPTDVAKVHTVNEVRDFAGSPPLKLPDGTADPDGFLPMPVYEAKLAAQGEAYGKAAGTQQAKDDGIEVPTSTAPGVPAVPVAPAAPAPAKPAAPAPAPGGPPSGSPPSGA